MLSPRGLGSKYLLDESEFLAWLRGQEEGERPPTKRATKVRKKRARGISPRGGTRSRAGDDKRTVRGRALNATGVGV